MPCAFRYRKPEVLNASVIESATACLSEGVPEKKGPKSIIYEDFRSAAIDRNHRKRSGSSWDSRVSQDRPSPQRWRTGGVHELCSPSCANSTSAVVSALGFEYHSIEVTAAGKLKRSSTDGSGKQEVSWNRRGEVV